MATTLTGSLRDPFHGAYSRGPAHPDERLQITFVLKPGNQATLKAHLVQIVQGGGTSMAHADYAAKHASDDTDVQKVLAFAKTHGLTVLDVNANAHRVLVETTVAKANTTFNVSLETFEHADGSYRGRTGEIGIPVELSGVVQAILGLDNRPAAAPHFRTTKHGNVRFDTRSANFYPSSIAELYNFPVNNGHGQTVALIELGGGYRADDLNEYFFRHEDTKAPVVVKTVSVDHALNAPTGDPDGPDGEVMLDIEVVGAVVPDATIVVYFAPNTDAGFLNAITTAMHDTVNKPSVISISWGGPERNWTQQAMRAFDAAFQQAASMGISVCVASGDNGSSDGEPNGNHVDFPASSPHVLACGGTNIQVSNSAISKEMVWNDGPKGGASGGGISAVFAAPEWQKTCLYQGKPIANRGVPDVAGNADPDSGYVVLVDGRTMVIGGTSAVAPLWAGLLARINSNRGSNVGFVQPALYANPSVLKDVTEGNNGTYAATVGWDGATGLGSPNGLKIAAVLK